MIVEALTAVAGVGAGVVPVAFRGRDVGPVGLDGLAVAAEVGVGAVGLYVAAASASLRLWNAADGMITTINRMNLDPQFSDDALHLNAEGYQAWLSELLPAMERLRENPPMTSPIRKLINPMMPSAETPASKRSTGNFAARPACGPARALLRVGRRPRAGARRPPSRGSGGSATRGRRTPWGGWPVRSAGGACRA